MQAQALQAQAIPAQAIPPAMPPSPGATDIQATANADRFCTNHADPIPAQ